MNNSVEKKTKNKSKIGAKKFLSVFAHILVCVSVLFFITYMFMVITDTEDYMSGLFKQSAYMAFDENVESVEAGAELHYDRLYEIAGKLEYADTKEDITKVLTEEYRNIIYVSNGNLYDAMGRDINSGFSGEEEIKALINTGAEGCSEVYFDTVAKTEFVAFFVPVRGSSFVDGIVSTIETRGIVDLTKIRDSASNSLLLMDSNGNILEQDTDQTFKHSVGDDLKSFMLDISSDNEIVNEIGAIISQNKKEILTFSSGKDDYTLSLAPINSFDDNIWLVNITTTEGFASVELEYIRHVVNISVLIIVAIALVSVYLVIRYKRKRALDNLVISIDAPDDCPGSDEFRINATKLIQNRERKYAFSIFEIRQFSYIRENISEKDMKNLLAYIAKLIGALCNIRETYGYLGNGKFALLIHVEDDRSIIDRVRLIESIAGKNSILGSGRTKRKFNIGISVTQQDPKQNYQELLGYAQIACEKAKNNINVPYVLFNEEIRSERMHNERIEAEMENALATGEFKLFLQPKYCVATDKIDSAEALVRWFDPEKGDYRFPGEFIGLFESNGFITKLDHFMYIETLKYLSSAAEKFDKIVPISVNVSMVTASSPDFLDFYVENKNKYRVGDNFIVIEFTESFAMEDHEKIRNIVETLHQNGIKCSLDDFGTGYSSLGTLKNIPFDELKFDRLFLSQGYNKENDDAMLETMFALTKSMGIRVVQEGVETKEMFDNIVAKGCDVIQGYYYAKAISLEEYKLFINSNTSIKYKSRVK